MMRRPFLLPLLVLVLFRPLHAMGADVSYYLIIKSQQLLQTNSSALVVPSTNAFVFDAVVVPSVPGLVSNAIVRTSSVAPAHVLVPLPDGSAFRFEQRFNTQTALDAAYPSGALFLLTPYSVTTYGLHDGPRTNTLSFGAGVVGSYPANKPQVGNFTAAQAIDSTAFFTLNWTFTGGQSSDVVQLTVFDAATNTLFSSPAAFDTGALNGLSNSCRLPPYALPAGRVLTAHLTAARPVSANTNGYPGAVGAAALAYDVQFPMVTRPAPLRPVLSLQSPRKPPFRIQITGETNRNYHLQVSANSLAWQDVLVTNLHAATATAIYTDPASTNAGRRFYRVKVGP